MYRNINYLVQTFITRIYMYNTGHLAAYKYKDIAQYKNKYGIKYKSTQRSRETLNEVRTLG